MDQFNFSKNQPVLVFADPIAEKHPEGRAVLIQPLKSRVRTESWLVKFVGENEIKHRKIKKDGKNSGELH